MVLLKSGNSIYIKKADKMERIRKRVENKRIKQAFTLAEILFCLILICFLYMIIISNIKTDNFEKKEHIANALKAVRALDEGSVKIRNTEGINCPNGLFIEEIAGKKELALYNDAGSTPSSSDVIGIFAKHLKFTKKGFEFCEHTSYCKQAKIKEGEVVAAKLPKNIIIGIQVNEQIGKCPAHYTVTTKEEVEGGKDDCWATVYIDVNGKKDPDKLNEDVFVFGLDKYGVHK